MDRDQLEQFVKVLTEFSERIVRVWEILYERLQQYIEVKKYQNQKEQCRNGWHHKTIIPLKQYTIIRKPFIRARANL